MSDTWVDAPRHMPHRCRRTGLSAPGDGPYFEESIRYVEGANDDREMTLYHSALWVRQMCDAPGSPLVVRTRAEDNAEFEALNTARADAERLTARVAELEAELEDARRDLRSQKAIVDVDALAEALGPVLEREMAQHFTRKPANRRAA